MEEFRVGGTSGGWKLVFGELAELGEGMLEFEILACRACGHIELRRPGCGRSPGPADRWAAVGKRTIGIGTTVERRRPPRQHRP